MKNQNCRKLIGPVDLVELLRHYEQLLNEYRAYLDSLNVFPVPDGDTGTNMCLTMKSVLKELDGLDVDDSTQIKEICEAGTKGAIMGARGNSGVLLSQMLKGFLDVFAESSGELDAKAFFAGTTLASKYAYEAVSEPVEGTMLTVIREIAESGNEEVELDELSSNFKTAGAKSLENTPNLLEPLKKAGVVDAGGAGLLLFFEALVYLVKGEKVLPAPEVKIANLSMKTEAKNEDTGTRYEVMFLLTAKESEIPAFRKSWEELGDSIVISGVSEIWSCHIHTDEIGKAIEAGISVGIPQDIRVTDLHEQVEHNDSHLDLDPEKEFLLLDTHLGDLDLPKAKTHIVVAGQGGGLIHLFGTLGARAMVLGGQTQNPPAKAFLEAIEEVEADEVVILPNNSNICAVAHSVAEQASKPVSVVETKTIPEGMSVLVAYDPKASASENATKLEEVRNTVTSGQVTQAVKDSKPHSVSAGDFIGLDNKDILVSSKNLVSATCDLLKKLITPNHELLVLVAGRQTTDSESQKIVECLEQNYPDLAVELLKGGQDLYHYYIGLE